MKLSTIMTFINIMGGGLASYCLLLTMYRYIIARKMGNYMVALFVTMTLLILSQFYMIVHDIETDWKLKLIGLYMWAKAIYFSWAIRFSSIKK
jgi:hypothetical protein